MIVIDLGSIIVTYAILTALAIFGWTRGFRYVLSIAFFITVGYLFTVQGGDYIVNIVNGFYTNLPQLAAFLAGRDPGSVAEFPPLIPANFAAPLLLRILVFFALLAIGIGYTFPWEGKPLQGFSGQQPLRILGALTGLYIGVLGINAVSTFWNQGASNVNAPPLLGTALSGLPTFDPIVPSVIAAFFIVLVVVIILRFNRIFQPDPPPAKK